MDDLTLDILRKRAMKLATPQTKTNFTTASKEYLIFQLGKTDYALPASTVVKVLNHKTIYPIPGVPSFIIGLINDGGRIYSVNDTHQLFGLEKANNFSNPTIILLTSDNLSFGILVDTAIGLRTFYDEQIDTRRTTTHPFFRHYCRQHHHPKCE